MNVIEADHELESTKPITELGANEENQPMNVIEADAEPELRKTLTELQ
jgi:hypothetical protein